MGFSGRNMSDLMRGVDVMPGTKPERVARNTIWYTHADGSRRCRLHDTDIVTRSADGDTVTLNTGGWLSMTTRGRMEEALDRLDIRSSRVYSCYGARIFTYEGVGFRTVLTLTAAGVPYETSRTTAESSEAHKEYNADRAKARRAYAPRVAELRRIKKAKRFGGVDWFNKYESQRAHVRTTPKGH